MEQFKIVTINTGSAVHLAEYFITPSDIEGHEVYCGSGKTGFRSVKRSAGKFDPSKITCKKCKKQWEEKYLNATEKPSNLKDWEEKYGKPEVEKTTSEANVLSLKEMKASDLIQLAIKSNIKWRTRVDGKDVKMNKQQLIEALSNL